MAGLGIISGDLPTLGQLLHLTMLRGYDSTGLLQVNMDGSFRVEKRVSHAVDFMIEDSRLPKPQMKDGAPLVHIAHCRAATKGSVNRKNAHPFDTGRYISCHNGTLHDYAYMDKEKTDSQMMFEDMEKRGVEEVLSDLDPWSAYAITMWDKEKKEMIFARNLDRTLYVGIDQEQAIMYWASEDTFLDFVAERRKIKMDIFYLQPHTVYRINPREISKGNNTPWNTTEVPSKPKTSFMWDDDYWGEGVNDKKGPNNQNFIQPESLTTSTSMTGTSQTTGSSKTSVPRVTSKKIKHSEKMVSSFSDFVEEVKANAERAEGKKECCICGEDGSDASRTIKYGTGDYALCDACDEWVEDLDPETGEIKVKGYA